MLVPEILRSTSESFGMRVPGYDPAEVRLYLGRLALAVEAFGDRLGPDLALPSYFTPAAISSQHFEVVGWGYSRRQVRALLDDLATDLRRRQGVVDLRTNQRNAPVESESIADLS